MTEQVVRTLQGRDRNQAIRTRIRMRIAPLNLCQVICGLLLSQPDVFEGELRLGEPIHQPRSQYNVAAGSEGVWNLVAHDNDLFILLIFKTSRKRTKAARVGTKPLLVFPVVVIIRTYRTPAAQHISFDGIERAKHLLRRTNQGAARLLTRQAVLDGAHNLLLPTALRIRR